MVASLKQAPAWSILQSAARGKDWCILFDFTIQLQISRSADSILGNVAIIRKAAHGFRISKDENVEEDEQ
jgi:hypothetical protein